MKSLKKFAALMTIALFLGVFFAGCSGSGGTDTQNTGSVTVRYLNFKPEIADKYEEIAKIYEEETGVKVVVETAANNVYEQTLAAKMSTSDAPTIFQVNGPKGYAAWKDYCADLSGTEIYEHLTDKSIAISNDSGVWAIPYVVEGYGIIYNNAIMEKYFALPEKATDYTSMSEINNFEALRAVVEDMQKNKDALGIEGVFASTSLKSGEDWRWQTHLLSLAVYYEFLDRDVDLTSDETATLDFTYSQYYKNIFDLYTENSVTEKSALGKKLVDESMAEFATGKAAMVQNGNWAWSQISETDSNVVSADDIKFLPIYMGVDGEESQGLCIGTENYLAINAKASEAEQKAAAEFIYWLFSSEVGKEYVVNELGFIAPFDTFDDSDAPSDPLAGEIISWMNKDGIKNIDWVFTIFPSQTFKDDVGSALLQYVQGSKTWAEVEETVTKKWASEYEASSD